MESLSEDFGNARRRLTILHTSDLHLGSDVSPQNALTGLDLALDKACEISVDAVLIAGDLFDSIRVPVETVNYVFASLDQIKRPVVILPGNHDTLFTSASSKFSFNELPPNVFMFRAEEGETIFINDLGIFLWGRPVYNHEPSFHPLYGLPPRPGDGWYIAMAHGLVVDSISDNGWSSPISVDELAQADCDYIALGHLHLFEDVTQGEASAFYSGATSDTQKPTVALVTLDPHEGVDVKAISLG